MSITDETVVPISRRKEAELVLAAQEGCQVSMNRLMSAYEGQIGLIIACQGQGVLNEQDAWQAGREGLWRAIVSYRLDSPERLWSLRWAIGGISSAILAQAKRLEWQRRWSPRLALTAGSHARFLRIAAMHAVAAIVPRRASG